MNATATEAFALSRLDFLLQGDVHLKFWTLKRPARQNIPEALWGQYSGQADI
jgi:hypothetical protein